jgi:diadenosine tetraphosphate (Ap4A) HIT family hydrolase
MMPEDKIEEQFEKLMEYLKWSAKIVRKIFTPDTFNYHFLYGEYEGHEVFKGYHVLQYWKTGQISDADRIFQEDIKKRRFELPDGIYPITKITEKLNLRAYMISRDKKKLGPQEVILEVISGPEEIKKIEIVYYQGDKVFIKNWEKVFGDDVSVLRSDAIFFLIVKNKTLEIRTFSLEENGVKMKFGIDRIMPETLLVPSLIPFGERPVIWQYRLSKLFFDLIISFLWNKDEDDKNKIITGIKNLVDKLWTDEMFKARREFLYIDTRLYWERDWNLHNLLKFSETKEELLDEMRKNPDKYLPKLPQKTKEVYFYKFYEIVEKSKTNLPPSVYLITQYRPGKIVLRDPQNNTIIFDIPDYWNEMRKSITKGKNWKIRFIYSWPTSNSSDAYLTLFHIDLPFNPYVIYEQRWETIVYIPDEIADYFLDNILKIEPRIQRWIEEEAKKDKEEIYKRLEDLLNGIKTGNLSSYTIWAFDDAREENKDKRKRMERWEREWKELEKESQTSESKKEEKKEKRRKKKEGTIIEVYSGLGKTEYSVQPKQEEISETSESKEEKQQEVFENVQKLKQEVEISKEEEKTFEKPKLQKEKEKQEVEIYTTSMKSKEISKKLDELFIALDNGIRILSEAFGEHAPNLGVLHPVFYSSKFPVGKTNHIDVSYGKVYRGEFKLKDGIYPIIENVLDLDTDFTINNFTILIEPTNTKRMIKIQIDETDRSLLRKDKYYGLTKVLFLVVEKGNMSIEYWENFLIEADDRRFTSFTNVELLEEEKNPKQKQIIYILSKMAVELIEDVLWRNDLLGGLKKFANNLFTYEMARARYIYSYVVEKLGKFDLSKDKRIEKWIDEIRRNPQKYPLPFSSNMPRLSFEDLLYGKHSLASGLYLITQWNFGDSNSKYGNIVLNNSIIIDVPKSKIRSYTWRWKENQWEIYFVYVWPNGTIHIFPTILSINPYLKTENNIIYITKELSETILKVLNDWPEKEIEQKAQNWLKEKENLLNEIIENVARIKQSEKTELIKPEEEQQKEKQEVEIDKEQEITTEKPRRKSKKKEEKISEMQQEKEKKEEKVEEKKVEEKTEIEKTTEEIKEQDIIEELLEGADVDVKAKVKSKVKVILPKNMIKDLEEPKEKTIKRGKKNKRKKNR